MIDDSQKSDGLLIVTARLRNAGLRNDFWDHMESLIGERVNECTYEFSISDWDDEIEWLTEFLEATGESIVIWRFQGDQHLRYVLGCN